MEMEEELLKEATRASEDIGEWFTLPAMGLGQWENEQLLLTREVVSLVKSQLLVGIHEKG